MTHEEFFSEAGKEARKALCKRDKCGAVVVLGDKIIGRGYNAPPQDDVSQAKCDLDLTSSPKPKADRTCCIHAEWRAIIDALKGRDDLKGGMIYFTRVDDEGNLLKSGEPYCTECSRLALDVGLSNFALWHEAGIKLYPTAEYNDLSYRFHLAC